MKIKFTERHEMLLDVEVQLLNVILPCYEVTPKKGETGSNRPIVPNDFMRIAPFYGLGSGLLNLAVTANSRIVLKSSIKKAGVLEKAIENFSAQEEVEESLEYVARMFCYWANSFRKVAGDSNFPTWSEIKEYSQEILFMGMTQQQSVYAKQLAEEDQAKFADKNGRQAAIRALKGKFRPSSHKEDDISLGDEI